MRLQDLNAIAGRLRALTPQVMREKILEIVRDNDKIAVAMNTDQLFAGKLADGEKMPDYSERSVTVFHKRPGPWTLYDTGAFYRNFYVDAKSFPISFNSKDLKTPRIMELLESKDKNPDEIFGLNKSNFRDFGKNYVLKDAQGFLRKIIGLR